MRRAPTTYETYERDGWTIAVSSSGVEIPGSSGELTVRLDWIAVGTKWPLHVYPRTPRTFRDRDEAVDALWDAIDVVEGRE